MSLANLINRLGQTPDGRLARTGRISAGGVEVACDVSVQTLVQPDQGPPPVDEPAWCESWADCEHIHVIVDLGDPAAVSPSVSLNGSALHVRWETPDGIGQERAVPLPRPCTPPPVDWAYRKGILHVRLRPAAPGAPADRRVPHDG